MRRPRASEVEPAVGPGGLVLSGHAAMRARQRGYRASDLELVERYGTVTSRGVVLLRSDVERLRQNQARLLSRLDRLVGSAVIVRDDTVVSVFRATRMQRRKWVRVVA